MGSCDQGFSKSACKKNDDHIVLSSLVFIEFYSLCAKENHYMR